MKMGIMELIMWTVFPEITSRLIVQITATIATIKGDMIRTNLRKKKSMSTKIMTMATGPVIAICLNICTPKVSSATGRPVM